MTVDCDVEEMMPEVKMVQSMAELTNFCHELEEGRMAELNIIVTTSNRTVINIISFAISVIYFTFF